MNRTAELRELAARQHGLVARRQASDLGLSTDVLRHGIRTGEWERVTRRVIRLAGAPRTLAEPAMLAALHFGPDVYVSGSSALSLWGLPGFALDPVHVLARRPVSRREPAIGRLHTTTDLFDSHITETRGIPLVTPVRAIFDIAGVLHPKRVERALDNAWNRHLLNGSLLARTVGELADRGRQGTVLMRELSEARPPDFRPPESRNESRVNELLERRLQPTLRRQVDAGDRSSWVGRFDLVDDELPLIVEVHSDVFHGSRLDQERDQAKREAMEAEGWTFVEVWENDIWRRGDWVVDQIVAARRMARRARNLVTSAAL